MERVTKKSFIITTLLMPVLMLAMMLMPILIEQFAGRDSRKVVVMDQCGLIAPSLQSDAMVVFDNAAVDNVDEALADESVDAVLVIPDNIMNNGGVMQFYTKGSSSLALESAITGQVNDIIETNRLKNYNIDNLSEIIDAVHSDVALQSIRTDEDGSTRESSTVLSYLLGIVLTFLLYMCLLLYGQMVMTSIIEEKNNRVLEIIVSSVKPTKLMLGKICGIGLVAVTQIVIWGVLLASISAFVLPAVMSPQVSADLTAYGTAGVDPTQLSTDIDMLQMMSMLGDTMYILQLFGLLLLFLIGGFMLYAAIYAAIGSAVDNIQDASQLQSIIVIPVVLGIVFGMSAASDPSSTLSMWTSMIPFTSPMVMMARIPFGISAWEIVTSLVILYVSFFIMVWVAAKIYRVGIFMYGKKPTVKELIRWARYK